MRCPPLAGVDDQNAYNKVLDAHMQKVYTMSMVPCVLCPWFLYGGRGGSSAFLITIYSY